MFDKDKFAELLKKAIGDRTTTDYADQTGVNRTYISKLLNKKLSNAPGPDIIKKLSSRAYYNISYESLMVAAGHWNDTSINACAEAISTYDEIQREIIIARESGVDIDCKTAERMIQNRKRLLKQEKPSHEEYVLSAPELPEALIRIANLLKRGEIDIDTADHLSDLAFDKFGIPGKVNTDEAAHNEIDIPGTGILEDSDEDDKNGKRRQ